MTVSPSHPPQQSYYQTSAIDQKLINFYSPSDSSVSVQQYKVIVYLLSSPHILLSYNTIPYTSPDSLPTTPVHLYSPYSGLVPHHMTWWSTQHLVTSRDEPCIKLRHNVGFSYFVGEQNGSYWPPRGSPDCGSIDLPKLNFFTCYN